MRIFALLPLVATALATPIIELNPRQSIPPPDQITIISAMTSGNGCPSGTVSTTFSPDKTVVTFGFDAFQTYIGPGTRPQDHSKNCQIHLSLKCKLPLKPASQPLLTIKRPWRLPVLPDSSNIPWLCSHGSGRERQLPFDILFLTECFKYCQLQGDDKWP